MAAATASPKVLVVHLVDVAVHVGVLPEGHHR
jgi:hypothetical protein